MTIRRTDSTPPTSPVSTPSAAKPASAAQSAAPAPNLAKGSPTADQFNAAGTKQPAVSLQPVPPPAPAGTGLPQIKHVFVIMMENQDWKDVKGNPKAPFINGQILPNSSYADNYVVGTHPSEPNYIELEAGSTLGIGDDGDPKRNHQATHDHLTYLMTQAGVTWKSYQEDIKGDKVPLTGQNHYQPKHNPNVFFDDNTGGLNPNDPFGIAHNRPYSELETDLKNGTAPQYSFITPNMINDGHDSAPPLNNGIAQSDAWLQKEIPKIMASDAYKDNGAIFIVWDEGKKKANNPSGMILLSPQAKGGGYHNNIPYSHGSTLRTWEEIFGFDKMLGSAATSTDLSDLFKPGNAQPTPAPAPSPTPVPSTSSEPKP